MVERHERAVARSARRALGMLTLAALVWTGYEFREVSAMAAPLRVPQAPRGLVSLQLPASRDAAATIRRTWACDGRPAASCTNVMPVASQVLAREPRMIAAWLLALGLLTIWAAMITRPARWFTLTVLGLIAASALADVAENQWLATQLVSGPTLSAEELTRLVALTRVAAMSKFVLLLLGGVGVLALTGGAWRLILLERLAWAGTGTDVVPPPEHARPRVGDELASFRELLSEWLARQQAKLTERERAAGRIDPGTPPQVPPELLFPSHRDAGSGPQDGVDQPQERHLREFSGFLAPRWGFFEVDTWTALVALISGLLPALAIALSVIGVLLIGWLSLTFSLAYRSPWAPLPFILLLTWGALYVFERLWHEVKSASAGHTEAAATALQPAPVRRGISRYIAIASTALVLVAGLQLLVPKAYAAFLPPGIYPASLLPVFVEGSWRASPGSGVFEQWWTVAGIAHQSRTWLFSPRLFDFSLVWLWAALVMVALRVSYALWPYFLDELLNTLGPSFARCYVVVKAPSVDAQHKVAMDDRRGFIEQYRKMGFREALATGAPGEELLDDDGVTASLGLDRGVDTLLVLDLGRWSRRRGR